MANRPTTYVLAPMRKLYHPTVVIYLLLSLVLPGAGYFSSECDAAACGAGKRPLYFVMNPEITSALSDSFYSELLFELDQPLQQIGYCITGYTSAVSQDSLLQDERIMMLSLNYKITPETAVSDPVDSDSATSLMPYYFSARDTTIQLVASTVKVRDWTSTERRKALANPLFSLEYNENDVVTFTSVLIKKIIENLRTQYICHVRIESIPEGASIRSTSGLEGVAPVEWVTPLGKLPVIGELDGFRPMRRQINLETPGRHTYQLKLRKRNFYHSPFFVSSIVLAASSATSFMTMYYYKKQYNSYDRNTRTYEPKLFEKTYNRAVVCQIGGFSLMALTGISLTLSFFF